MLWFFFNLMFYTSHKCAINSNISVGLTTVGYNLK